MTLYQTSDSTAAHVQVVDLDDNDAIGNSHQFHMHNLSMQKMSHVKCSIQKHCKPCYFLPGNFVFDNVLLALNPVQTVIMTFDIISLWQVFL